MYKRVIHLVAMAFMKDNTPKKIISIINDPRLCFLCNIKKIKKPSTKPSFEISRNVMPFTSQEDLSHYCLLNGISTAEEFMRFQGLNEDELDQANPTRFSIGDKPMFECDARQITFYGKPLKLSRVGELFYLKGDEWRPFKGRRQNRRSLSFYVICADGKSRPVNIANLMAKAFLGLSSKSRRKIKYIDGNPNNLHVNNLWWSDCERPFNFDDILTTQNK